MRQNCPAMKINFLSIFNSKDVSNIDYNKFIDTGRVSQEILEKIAKKVMKQESLGEKEQAIFYSKISEINQIIIKFHNS